MIALPPGFDADQLYTEFFALAIPFVTIAFIIGSAFLLIRILKRA